ncbi:MAG: Smr/MutS family protein [Acidobacteria bacterium]|nr:Smr/MutS family protein [Acidobacteriota bacterium]
MTSEPVHEPPAEDAEGLVIEITDVLDLHAFAPRDIASVVETYLEEARAKGYSTVRIIHGKGIGVQRERVRAVLQRTPFVASFADAPLQAGSWGATVVWLTR